LYLALYLDSIDNILILNFRSHFICLFFSAFLLTSLGMSAQNGKVRKGFEPEDAEEHFKHHNYMMAMRVYKVLYVQDKKNIDFNYKLALCYLNTNINKKEAIPYLEFVTKQEKFDPEAMFELGRAYHYANRFDDAIRTFNKYKKNLDGKNLNKVDREIEMCYNGKEFMKFPIKVTFENMKELNTEYPDYYPFVTTDESMVVFTSRRKGNVGATSVEVDGYYSSDVYISTVTKGEYSKPKNAGGSINGRYDEQCVGLAPDGSSMMVYIDNITDLGNIYKSTFNKTSFAKPIKYEGEINEGFETAGSLSPDGNTLYFASDRDGGKGLTDIYMVKKLPNGSWAKPQPITILNTQYREDFPFMSSDGKTLYFASEGHSSMGGFDIFKSVYNEETNTWSNPKNLGYPINDGQDNRTISFSASNRTGYISACRDGGMGDLDIYRVVFDDALPRYTIISGTVVFTDSLRKGNINAIITVTNTKTKLQTGTYTPVSGTGKYVIALSPGTYMLTVESPKCKPFVQSVTIFDMGSFEPEITMNMALEQK
jgi:tetratricopeptide (TPR) repeat protein